LVIHSQIIFLPEDQKNLCVLCSSVVNINAGSCYSKTSSAAVV
jgi:hypothetical protein